MEYFFKKWPSNALKGFTIQTQKLQKSLSTRVFVAFLIYNSYRFSFACSLLIATKNWLWFVIIRCTYWRWTYFFTIFMFNCTKLKDQWYTLDQRGPCNTRLPPLDSHFYTKLDFSLSASLISECFSPSLISYNNIWHSNVSWVPVHLSCIQNILLFQCNNINQSSHCNVLFLLNFLEFQILYTKRFIYERFACV